MICEKCGAEFEGRNCTNCGALAIFVKDDEYQERRQEWEEENAPKDEEKKKFQLNIHVNPVIVKKCAIIVIAVCIILALGFDIARRVGNFLEEEGYVLVYDNGTVMNADSRSFEVYPVEDAIFSVDGNYVYDNKFSVEGVQGEVLSSCVSPSGEFAAVVSMEGIDTAVYYLYAVKNEENAAVELIRSGNNEIQVVEVTNTGKIYYEEAELGAYNVVLTTSLYQYEAGKNQLVVEDIQHFVPCENENEFIYYDRDMLAYLYSEGKVTALDEDGYGYEYALSSKGVIYYLTLNGELYVQGKVGSMDRGIVTGTLRAVANSDKVIYVKDGALYCYGEGMKAPVELLAEYDAYEEKCQVLEHHGKLYYAYNGTMYIKNESGKQISAEEGVEAVYFQMK